MSVTIHNEDMKSVCLSASLSYELQAGLGLGPLKPIENFNVALSPTPAELGHITGSGASAAAQREPSGTGAGAAGLLRGMTSGSAGGVPTAGPGPAAYSRHGSKRGQPPPGEESSAQALSAAAAGGAAAAAAGGGAVSRRGSVQGEGAGATTAAGELGLMYGRIVCILYLSDGLLI